MAWTMHACSRPGQRLAAGGRARTVRRSSSKRASLAAPEGPAPAAPRPAAASCALRRAGTTGLNFMACGAAPRRERAARAQAWAWPARRASAAGLEASGRPGPGQSHSMSTTSLSWTAQNRSVPWR